MRDCGLPRRNWMPEIKDFFSKLSRVEEGMQIHPLRSVIIDETW